MTENKWSAKSKYYQDNQSGKGKNDKKKKNKRSEERNKHLQKKAINTADTKEDPTYRLWSCLVGKQIKVGGRRNVRNNDLRKYDTEKNF